MPITTQDIEKVVHALESGHGVLIGGAPSVRSNQMPQSDRPLGYIEYTPKARSPNDLKITIDAASLREIKAQNKLQVVLFEDAPGLVGFRAIDEDISAHGVYTFSQRTPRSNAYFTATWTRLGMQPMLAGRATCKILKERRMLLVDFRSGGSNGTN